MQRRYLILHPGILLDEPKVQAAVTQVRAAAASQIEGIEVFFTEGADEGWCVTVETTLVEGFRFESEALGVFAIIGPRCSLPPQAKSVNSQPVQHQCSARAASRGISLVAAPPRHGGLVESDIASEGRHTLAHTPISHGQYGDAGGATVCHQRLPTPTAAFVADAPKAPPVSRAPKAPAQQLSLAQVMRAHDHARGELGDAGFVVFFYVDSHLCMIMTESCERLLPLPLRLHRPRQEIAAFYRDECKFWLVASKVTNVGGNLSEEDPTILATAGRETCEEGRRMIFETVEAAVAYIKRTMAQQQLIMGDNGAWQLIEGKRSVYFAARKRDMTRDDVAALLQQFANTPAASEDEMEIKKLVVLKVDDVRKAFKNFQGQSKGLRLTDIFGAETSPVAKYLHGGIFARDAFWDAVIKHVPDLPVVPEAPCCACGGEGPSSELAKISKVGILDNGLEGGLVEFRGDGSKCGYVLSETRLGADATLEQLVEGTCVRVVRLPRGKSPGTMFCRIVGIVDPREE